MKKITLLFLIVSSISFGQNFVLDPTFNPSDTGIYTEEIGTKGVFLDNGKILTGQGFGMSPSIFRLNNDGSVDNTFPQLMIDYYIDRFFADKALGNFITTSHSYDTNNEIALRSYNANGGLINSFTSPIFKKTNNTQGSITKIVFLNDGKFLVLGNFNLVNGISYNNIVRLNANGSIDSTFNVGTGFNGYTTACAIQSDGKYVIGGAFLSYNGTTKARVARIGSNGVLDTTFNVNTVTNQFGISYGYDPDGPINDIVVQPNGKILTSGANLYANGSVVKRSIVRLNSNGTTDSTFYMGHYTEYFPGKILYAPDGSIYFHDYRRILKCTNTGSPVYTFNDANTEGGREWDEYSDISYQNNKIMVVGNYKSTVGNTRMGYHRLNTNGSLDLTFNPSFGVNSRYFDYPNEAMYSSLLPDNKILLYGSSAYKFSTYNDVPVKSIIRLTQNGELDPGFNLSSSVSSSMIFQSYWSENPVQAKKNYDGTLYIKGDFPGTRILKLNYDGSVDANFHFYNQVYTFKITNDNKIIASGGSDIFKNGSYFKLVRFNPDNTVDNTFTSPTFTHMPINIELLDDSKILVSFGDETAFTINVGAPHIVRLNQNGSLDNTFNFYTTSEIFRAKTINGKTYVSGIGSFNSSFLGKCNSDGTLDTSFTQIPTGYYSTIYASLSNGRTVTTTNLAGQNNSLLYRVNNANGIQTATFSAPGVTTLVSQSCENIILCGNFHEVNGTNKNNLYRLTVPGSSIIPTPEAELNQLFTSGQTLSDLVINGQNIQWYTAQNECANNDLGRNPNEVYSLLPGSTLLVDGTTYYASQAINGIESNHRMPVTVHQNLGVNEFSLADLKVYPNPVKNNLTVSNSSVIDKVELYTLFGQKIMEKSFSIGEVNLDFSNYTKGMYLLKIFSEGKNETCKIIRE
ncbi:T9SS type A sorting domain-containing protein [Flavobacterium sp.]|uniref:T9SS type A sorting domain-containing protein n=1 Tax=Flavobacterium sp. TaxID=239 RepID=UPI003D6B74E5